MEKLWRTWRMEYIETAREREGGCIFCDLPLGKAEDAMVLKDTGIAFAVMNLYPYNPGHVMVAPRRHTADLESLASEEMAEVGRLLQQAVDALKAAMTPEGFNIGMNLGRVAGAGVPGHLHWHVVPRWNGDSNFMPILGETRVLPELVEQTFEKLRPGFRDVHH